MKKFKKFVSVLCAISMILAVSVSAFAAEANPQAVEGYTLDGARVVGTQFTASTRWKSIPLEIGSSVTSIKVWVHCESGSMNVRIVDEDGTVIKPTQTLIAGSETPYFEYWFDRSSSYSGDYYLEVRGNNGYSATGWYNWVEEK